MPRLSRILPIQNIEVTVVVREQNNFFHLRRSNANAVKVSMHGQRAPYVVGQRWWPHLFVGTAIFIGLLSGHLRS
jgi:hypothetical protein